MYLHLYSSTEYAEAISRLLFAVSRPASVRKVTDQTVRYCNYITHPETDAVALDLPEGDTIYVHPDCDTSLVSQIESALAEGEADALRDEIETRRGTYANPLTLIPASAQSRLMDRGEAEAAGWFTGLEEL